MILAGGYCARRRVFYVGKPHGLVYDEALRLLAEVEATGKEGGREEGGRKVRNGCVFV